MVPPAWSTSQTLRTNTLAHLCLNVVPLKNSYIFSDNMETTVTLHLNDESIRDFVYIQQSPDSDFGYPGT